MGEIGENGDFDGDAEDTVLSEGVRGDLENEKINIFGLDGGDTLIEGESVDGGHVAELGLESVDTPSDSSHEADFVTGMAQHLPNHEGSGGFAIGASDGDDAHVASREAVFEAREY